MNQFNLDELKQLTESITDKQLLSKILQSKDDSADYVAANNIYKWYFAIGFAKRAKKIVEIGTRFGYSLYALAAGTINNSVKFPDIIFYDAEFYEPGSVAIAVKNMNNLSVNVEGHKLNSQTVDKLPINDVDIFSVDGDHSVAGTLHDLELALSTLAKDGIILLDDIDFIGDVKTAAIQFINKYKLTYLYIPTFRGLYIIWSA